jgi:hypothetical protein
VFIQPVVFLKAFSGEMDFWAGTFGLAVFALIETILFAWVFGMDKAWAEITRGADIRIPRVFYYVIRYVTPLYLLFILGFWTIQDAKRTLLMEGVEPADRPVILWARAMMVLIMAGFVALVTLAWRRRKHRGGAR